MSMGEKTLAVESLKVSLLNTFARSLTPSLSLSFLVLLLLLLSMLPAAAGLGARKASEWLYLTKPCRKLPSYMFLFS